MNNPTKTTTKKVAKKNDFDLNELTTNGTENNSKSNSIAAQTAATNQKPKSLIIKLDELVPFEDHPYKVVDNDSMKELVKSIR